MRKDLPASLRPAIQESLVTMQEQTRGLQEAGATSAAFPADDGKYQVIRDLNETSKRLVAQQ